jgi:short-subunit dehydrogenase involved in D-alanine esterification of teichoic acids
LVERYHRDGWRVATCGRNPEALAALRAQFPGIVCLEADIGTPEGRQRFRDGVVSRVGALAGLVNNAAVQYRSHGDEARLQEEIDVNLLAPIALGNAFAPHFGGPSPFIANVSSGLAYIPFAQSPVYCASKAGLSQYTRAVRRRLPALRFVEVVLPMVDTPMTAGRGRGKMTAAEAARQIARGIERGSRTIRVGKARLLPWLGWLAPGLVEFLMNRADPVLLHR